MKTLLLLLSLFTLQAFTCSCAHPPKLKELIKNSKYIIEAKALNSYIDDNSNYQSLQIVDIFKGNKIVTGEYDTSFLPENFLLNDVLFVRGGNNFAMCGQEVRLGKEESVILFLDSKNKLVRINSCSSYQYLVESENKKKYQQALEFLKK